MVIHCINQKSRETVKVHFDKVIETMRYHSHKKEYFAKHLVP